MEYEIMFKDGTVVFAYGIKELKETIKNDKENIEHIWKNIKYNGTNEDVTKKYIK